MSALRLGEMLAARRAERGLTLRAAADEIGVQFSTLARVERGADCRASHAERIWSWLGFSRMDGLAVAWRAGHEAGIAEGVRALGAGMRMLGGKGEGADDAVAVGGSGVEACERARGQSNEERD